MSKTLSLDALAIRQRILAKRWKVSDLARDMDTSDASLHYILNGRNITLRTLGRLCDSLGCAPADVLTWGIKT